MDRARAVTWSERAGGGRGPGDEFILPSRGEAIRGLASALDDRRGPVLLTGEAGVGKSWVCRRLRDAMPDCWRWASVDLSPAIDEGEVYRLILHALGVDQAGGPAESRATLGNLLAESAQDGERWGLVVDEVHHASVAVLEELRVLGNRMGETGAFAGLILIGQNALARRVGTRPLAALQSRLSAREHLRPLTVEELHAWLQRLDRARNWDDEAVERLHRETGGNPRRLLGRSSRQAVPAAGLRDDQPGCTPATRTAPAKAEPVDVGGSRTWEPPPITPTKPPLQISDGMIEVGWEPAPGAEESGSGSDMQTAAEGRTPSTPPCPTKRRAADGSEEVINDHYAALQAWTEWAQNQGREPVTHDATGERVATGTLSVPAVDGEVELDPDENPIGRVAGHPGVWVEGQHDFAPYSQLFSRLRQPKENQ